MRLLTNDDMPERERLDHEQAMAAVMSEIILEPALNIEWRENATAAHQPASLLCDHLCVFTFATPDPESIGMMKCDADEFCKDRKHFIERAMVMLTLAGGLESFPPHLRTMADKYFREDFGVPLRPFRTVTLLSTAALLLSSDTDSAEEFKRLRDTANAVIEGELPIDPRFRKLVSTVTFALTDKGCVGSATEYMVLRNSAGKLYAVEADVQEIAEQASRNKEA
jgi:hypothetical protein